MAKSRLVLTFATGDAKYKLMACAMSLSVRLRTPGVRTAIITDQVDDATLQEAFDLVLPVPTGFDHWFIKLSALGVTDADEILFIDGDCLAVRDLRPVFETLQGSGFAVQGTWKEDPSPWYGNWSALLKQRGLARVPQFSGGFLYYERGEVAERVIERTMALAKDYDALGLQRNGKHIVDEVCISIAMAELGMGKVFEDHYQFSCTPWRAVGRIHLDVLQGRCAFFRSVGRLELAEPAIYHSAMANSDWRYWREVRKVLRAAKVRIPPRMHPGPKAKVARKIATLWTRLWCSLFSLGGSR